jgi:hypothetical protein
MPQACPAEAPPVDITGARAGTGREAISTSPMSSDGGQNPSYWGREILTMHRGLLPIKPQTRARNSGRHILSIRHRRRGRHGSRCGSGRLLHRRQGSARTGERSICPWPRMRTGFDLDLSLFQFDPVKIRLGGFL